MKGSQSQTHINTAQSNVTIQLSAQLAPVQTVVFAENNSPNATNQNTISIVLRIAFALSEAHFLKRSLCAVSSW